MSILVILAGLKRFLESKGIVTQIYGVPVDTFYPAGVIEVFKTTKEHIHAGTYYVYQSMLEKGFDVDYGGEYKTRLRIKLYHTSLNMLTKLKHQILMALERGIELDISDRVVGYETIEDKQVPIIEVFDVGLSSEELAKVIEWNQIDDREKAKFEFRISSTDSYSYPSSGKTVWGEIINLDVYYLDNDNIKAEYTDLVQQINISDMFVVKTVPYIAKKD